MAKYIINGNQALRGEITVGGNKNSVLKLIPAALLTDAEVNLTNVPEIKDVEVMLGIISKLGVALKRQDDKLSINASGLNSSTLPDDLVKELRASILLMGPLLARFGQIKFRYPGGCKIGRRPLNTHFKAFEALGAKITSDGEIFTVTLDQMNYRGAPIFLQEPSVTATENTIMAAVLAKGETTIENAACEPHVTDLVEFLNSMGARITGQGTNRLQIVGVTRLHGASHRVRPDHIEVGTFIIASAITQGEVIIHDAIRADLKPIIPVMANLGVKLEWIGERSLKVSPNQLVSNQTTVKTQVWPGFPTDLLSPFIVLATQASGTTLCHDWMYESRMFFVDKLISMGASIILCDPHRVVVNGPSQLRGKFVDGPDIRAGMALVLAALAATGESTIDHAEIIERGYEKLVARLAALGANIQRKE